MDQEPLGNQDQTTFHVRAAKSGDSDSLTWIVKRFSPLLLIQARYRLNGPLLRIVDPEDLVQELWSVAIQRLPDLDVRSGRHTPVLIRFLSTTLLQLTNNLARKQLRRSKGEILGDDFLPANHAFREVVSGVVSRLARKELSDKLLEAIEELDDDDKQVVVLRAIEQLPNKLVAEMIGETPNAVSLRYGRAMERLKSKLGSTILDEL